MESQRISFLLHTEYKNSSFSTSKGYLTQDVSKCEKILEMKNRSNGLDDFKQWCVNPNPDLI